MKTFILVLFIALSALPFSVKCYGEAAQDKEEEIEFGPVGIAMCTELPHFPGDTKAMYEWLSENINYPTKCAKKGIEGKVAVIFGVTAEGKIVDIAICRSANPTFNAEVFRAISMMPDWIAHPSDEELQYYPVRFVLPVNFSLKNSIP